ncbi:MAG: OmpA family protein [Nitrosomonadales bacterium]|nr:OmpA family protein [Nitrosomonadales bacterium]
MNKFALPLLFAALLGTLAPAQAAETPLPERLQQIVELQRRADKLAFGGLGSDHYHLAKARTWLDLATSEYHQTDNSGIVDAAIGQAKALLDALENRRDSISMETPMQLQGSEAVRQDLWEKITVLKGDAKFTCGQRQLAEAEVQLVWTGHEKAESGWSHAQSYARGVENLVYEAQVAIANCGGEAGRKVIEKYVLSTDTLFAFDSAELIPGATARLDRLADTVKGWHSAESVTLVGHTDRYGPPAYNQKLSEQRAERIRQYLIGKGIAPERIRSGGAGSTQPLVTCPTALSKQEQVSCLQPNRRVEIILRGSGQ